MIQIFQSEILDVKNLPGSVKIFQLSVPQNFSFKAGQYVSISVPFEGKKIRRPYSIASSPNKKKIIDLCVKIIPGGLASDYLKDLKKGDKVELLGPAGKFVIYGDSLERDIIFVAVGTGITPFVSMIHDLLEKEFKNKIILIKGFRYNENILYEKEFSELGKNHKNFEFHNVLSRPDEEDYENKGYVQDFLEKCISDISNSDVYICGLSPMINAVKEKAIELKIPENRVFFEKYD